MRRRGEEARVGSDQEQKARDAHSEGFFQAFHPVGAPEEHLVQTMVRV